MGYYERGQFEEDSLCTTYTNSLNQVFGYDFIRAQNLISSLPDELHQKLARSFSTYDGKDGLLVVVRDRNKGHALVNLERQPGVKTITLSQLCPCPPASEATNASADVPTSSNPPPPAEASVINEEREEYTQTEMEKAVKLQQWWRAVFPCIASRRTSMSTSMGQAITRFVKLGGQFPNDIRSLDRTTIRRILHTDCIALSFRVTAARESLHKLQKDSMECVEHVELSQGGYESVDEILGRIREAESQVKKAAEMMDDDALALLVKGADPQQLERIVADVDDLLEKAEQAMLETRLDVDGIAKGPA